METNNNTIFIICGTVIAIVLAVVIVFANLSEQVEVILATGIVAIATGIISNVQRNKQTVEENDNDIKEILNKNEGV